MLTSELLNRVVVALITVIPLISLTIWLLWWVSYASWEEETMAVEEQPAYCAYHPFRYATTRDSLTGHRICDECDGTFAEAHKELGEPIDEKGKNAGN